jgi:hypothetical protein
MEITELKSQIDAAPVQARAALQKMYLYATAGGKVLPELAKHLDDAASYQEFFQAIFRDVSQKNTLLWAECAKFTRRNWLAAFEPQICVQNLKMKTDGLPIQLGSGVVLAPTGSRDNIANLYVFDNGAFNRQAAEYVTSLAGKFTVADYEFFGIYGLYKYRGNVILEEWEREAAPVYNPEPLDYRAAQRR